LARIAVVVVSVDGFQTLHGGVGRLVRNVVYSTPHLKAALAARGHDIDLHFAEPSVSPTYRFWTARAFEELTATVSRHGGRFWRLVNPADGDPGPPPSIEQYAALSSAALQVAMGLTKEYDGVAVVGGDHYFALLPEYLGSILGYADLPIAVLHLTHSELPGESAVTQQVNARAAAAADCEKGIFIGPESEHMMEQYASRYGVESKDQILARTGIPIERLHVPFSDEDSATWQAKARALTERLGLSSEESLLITWGRASDDKGFDVLIGAMSLLREANARLVICSPVPFPEMERLAAGSPAKVTFLPGLEDRELHALLGAPNAKLALFSSRREPAAVAPLEAMWFGRRNSLNVMARRGLCFTETIRDGETGILIPDNTPETWAEYMGQALSHEQEAKTSMANLAADYVKHERSFTPNFTSFLSEFIERGLP